MPTSADAVTIPGGTPNQPAVGGGQAARWQRAGLPAASLTGHRVLAVLSSPLPVVFAYPLALLAGPPATAQKSQ